MPQPSPTISLRAVLRLPALQCAVPEVLTAHSELDRTVRWVHAGEVPHLPRLLRGGELLLTGGMGIGSDPAKQRQFIARLADRGVAAVAIELGVTFAEMPSALRKEADRRGLPLIALHRESAFVDITEAVHREIVSHQHVLMRRGEELHNSFTRLMLDGAAVTDVLTALAEAVANPVLLEKAEHGLLYHATHHAGDPEVLAAWEGLRRGLPDGPLHVETPVPMGRGETWGRLIVLGVDSAVDEFALDAAERAAGLIALALMRSREEDLLTARERGNLLTDLLDGQLDEHEARRRAESLGFDCRPSAFLPIVLASNDQLSAAVNGASSETSDTAWAAVLRQVAAELASSGIPAIGGLRGVGGDVMLVLGLRSVEARIEAAGAAAKLMGTVASRHLGATRFAICVGAVTTSWHDLREAMHATLEAAPAALAAPARPWHDIETPDLDRLLWSLRRSPELLRFSQRRLAALIDHDARRKVPLLATLSAYLACGGRKAETARLLHLERQSLYQRLHRIEAILGEGLDDEDVRFSLELALRTMFRDTPQATDFSLQSS